MTTKENYVDMVFRSELDKYPPICRRGVSIPDPAQFGIEFIPPQWDPSNVRNDDPDLYDAIHRHIIDGHMGEWGARRYRSLDAALYGAFQDASEDEARRLISRFLSLCGLTHAATGDWDVFSGRWRQRVRNRIPTMRDEIARRVRSAMDDLAWRGIPFPSDLVAFMRVMVEGRS